MERQSARSRNGNQDISKQLYFSALVKFPTDIFPVYIQRPKVAKIKLGEEIKEVRNSNFNRWEKNKKEGDIKVYISLNRSTHDLKSIKTSSRTGVVKLKEGRIPVWKKQKLRMLNKPIPVQLPLPLRR